MIVVSFFFQVIKSALEYCSSYAMRHVANTCISPCGVLSAMDCQILFNADKNEVMTS